MRVHGDAKAVALTLLLWFVTSFAIAQQPSPQSAPNMPVFKSKAELVLVPVSVRDKSGRHIAGLKQDAFAVKQDGHEQKVAVFEEITTGAKLASHPQLPPGVFTNAIADSQQRRLVIIALDTINTGFMDQAYARQNLIKFLSEQVQPDTLLCLVSINRGGIKLIHDFSTDPRMLVAALHKVKGTAAMADSEMPGDDPALDALQNDPLFQTEVNALNAFVNGQTDMQRNDWRMRVLVTLDALNEMAQAFAGIPGRKSLLWATGGFPFMFTDPNEAQNGPQFKEILPQYERTWQLLNSANMAVYPVDVRGLVNYTIASPSIRLSARNSRTFVQTAADQHYQVISGMETVAEMTGGRAFYNTNDLARSFRRATEDSESYYLLGYYRDSNDTKPGWRKLKVEVKAEHAEVRARSGFYVAKAAKKPEDTRKSDMQLAMVSPMEYTAVPMLLRWMPAADSPKVPGKKKVPFAVILPASAMEIDGDDSNHMMIEVFGLITDHEGKQIADIGQTINAHLNAESLKQVTTSGITYKNAFDIAPGDYTARLVVRDSISGKMGTVITPLKVQ